MRYFGTFGNAFSLVGYGASRTGLRGAIQGAEHLRLWRAKNPLTPTVQDSKLTLAGRQDPLLFVYSLIETERYGR